MSKSYTLPYVHHHTHLKPDKGYILKTKNSKIKFDNELKQSLNRNQTTTENVLQKIHYKPQTVQIGTPTASFTNNSSILSSVQIYRHECK